jgi:hypothetical protein
MDDFASKNRSLGMYPSGDTESVGGGDQTMVKPGITTPWPLYQAQHTISLTYEIPG